MLVKHILLITFIAFFGSFVFASHQQNASSNFNGTLGADPNGSGGILNGNGQISIIQNKTSSWDDKGVTFNVFDVILVNTGTTTIFDATISIDFNITKPSDIWTVEMISPMKYHFPGYLVQNGLEKGQNLTFGYINTGNSQSNVAISNIQSK